MFLKKYTKNLRSILTVFALFGLGLAGFFWAACLHTPPAATGAGALNAGNGLWTLHAWGWPIGASTTKAVLRRWPGAPWPGIPTFCGTPAPG